MGVWVYAPSSGYFHIDDPEDAMEFLLDHYPSYKRVTLPDDVIDPYARLAFLFRMTLYTCKHWSHTRKIVVSSACQLPRRSPPKCPWCAEPMIIMASNAFLHHALKGVVDFETGLKIQQTGNYLSCQKRF